VVGGDLGCVVGGVGRVVGGVVGWVVGGVVGWVVGGVVGWVVGGVVGPVVGGVVVTHGELVKTLLSKVTAPLRARARPSTVAPVFRVIEVNAMMFPTKVVVVPSVADEPTCQNTLQAWAPPVRMTELFEPVMSVLPAWKMKTESAVPLRVSGSGPLRVMSLDAVYTPEVKV
jgi:hypothetical protein